jgi:hypothetical protein
MLFSWTDGPAGTGAADDAWYIAEVYADAVRRREAGDPDEAEEGPAT